MVDAGAADATFDAARAGDEGAIASLFRLLNPPLLHYVRHHAPHVTEDLIAETWMAAAQKLPTFEGDAEGFRAWMFTVARRRIADHYRGSARRPQFAMLSDEVDLAGPDDTAAAVIDRMSTDQAINALVRSLPRDQAEVVLLRVVAGLSVDYVAQLTGRSAGSVRVLQHRALKRLATTWGRGAVTI